MKGYSAKEVFDTTILIGVTAYRMKMVSNVYPCRKMLLIDLNFGGSTRETERRETPKQLDLNNI